MEPILQCEPMDSIDIHYIYLNKSNQIEKITTEIHTFDKFSENNILPKEILIKYAQNKRILNKIRYKLEDILVYLVALEPSKIKEFSNTQDISSYSVSFLKKLPILDDVKFEPTLYMFHHINSIFIFFQEPDTLPSTKSILKKGTLLNKKHTKKVRISPDVSFSTTPNSNKTHKSYDL